MARLQKDVTTFLLDKKADINARDDGGNTPLHIAVAGDYEGVSVEGGKVEPVIEVVETLLQRGADLNQKNNDGATPLRLAREAQEQAAQEDRNLSVIELLRKRGAKE
jgi:ankyrin repeat protein